MSEGLEDKEAGDGGEASDSYPLSPATISEQDGEAGVGFGRVLTWGVDNVGRTVPESELESSPKSTELGTAARVLISKGSTVATSRDL